ncbi:MAG: cytochrome C [Candidatus Omnitrophota bacterium]|nr:MAG: cytochrome C [Candidatus Omnitrophota bacterium]
MRKNVLSIKGVILCASLILIFSFICACKSGVMRSKAPAPTIPGASYVGDETCLGCHEDANPDLMAAYKHSIHAAIADFETTPYGVQKGCEACHGPGSIHAEGGDPASIINLKKVTPDEASAICLKCHKSGALMKWQGSEHSLNGVSCIECHKIHQARSAIQRAKAPSSAWERKVVRPHALIKAEPDLCYKCHKEIQTRLNYTSHHPVREGKMVCSECHEPHGSPRLIKTEGRTINDACFTCHPQYQGPFAYEHDPVVEDCTICHEPHGTVVNNLLKKTEPFLCLQCHHIHSPISSDESVKQVVGRKCSYCHPEIHGSNAAPHLGAKF